MATMAAVASSSTFLAAPTARPSPSASKSRCGIVGVRSSTSLALKQRSVIINGRSLRTSSSSGNVRHFAVKAASSEDVGTVDGSKQVDDLVADLKAKWDGVENKSTVAIYAGGALITLWLSSTIIGAVNSVPVLPKLLELVGLGYTGWFVYRYLLFKSSRKELVSDIEELKGKITGATGSITGKEEKIG